MNRILLTLFVLFIGISSVMAQGRVKLRQLEYASPPAELYLRSNGTTGQIEFITLSELISDVDRNFAEDNLTFDNFRTHLMGAYNMSIQSNLGLTFMTGNELELQDVTNLHNLRIGSGNTNTFVGSKTSTPMNFLMNNVAQATFETDGDLHFYNKIGVGISPAYALDVVGEFRLNNATEGIDRVLRSDANGLASWVDLGTLGGGTDDQTLQEVLTSGNDAGGLDAMNFAEVEADEFIGDLRGAVLFKAQAGEALAKGDVVYVSGISGNTTIVSKADADDANKMPAFGVVAAAASSPNPVDIYTFGTLSNLNTSAYSLGDVLYVSTTAGQLTATPPTGESALLQNIAKVTRVDNSAGSIKISGAGRTNATPNLNTGRLFVGNASNQAVADGTMYVDIANSRVGIGVTPSAKLDVDGKVNIRGTTNITHFNYGVNEDTYLRSGLTGSVVYIQDGGRGDVSIDGANGLYYDQSSARIGIGLTNPLERFVVSGGNMQLRGTTYTDFTDYWGSNDNSAFFTPYGFLGSSGSFATSLYSNGYRNDTAGFTYIGTNGNTSTASGIDLLPTGDIYFRNGTASGTSLPIVMTIKNGGNTGIGTSSPVAKLHIKDALPILQIEDSSDGDGSRIRLKGTTANNQVDLINDVNSNYTWWRRTNNVVTHYDDANNFIWRNTGGSTERMRLNSTGLGIGVTPSAKLDVVGEFQLDNATNGTNRVLIDSDGSGNTEFVDLSTLSGGTDDQTLSLITNTLSIEDGNSVDLSGYLDNTDSQTLSFTSPNLSISGGNSVDISAIDTDTQLTQEEVEDFVGGMVTGNTETGITVTYQDIDGTIDFVTSDTSPTNEYNTNVALVGNDLQVTDGGGTLSTSLASYLDNTDDQKIDVFNITSNTLNLSLESDGEATKTVDLSPYLDNTDAQDLSLSGNTLSLTGDATTVDLSGYLDNTDSQGLTWVDGTNTMQISGGTDAVITGFAETGHTHTESDITDLDHYDLATLLTEDGAGSGLDADLFDNINSSQFMRTDVNDQVLYPIVTTFFSNSTIGTTAANQASLQVYNGTAGNDAFMTFHVAGDYATYFGLDGGINDFVVGGWSMGANSYRVWHEGNDGAGSGLDADLLDGQSGAYYLDNTDSQTLSLATNTLSISGGNSVDLSSYLDNTDNQTLQEVLTEDNDGGAIGIENVPYIRPTSDNASSFNLGSSGYDFSNIDYWTQQYHTFKVNGSRKMRISDDGVGFGGVQSSQGHTIDNHQGDIVTRNLQIGSTQNLLPTNLSGYWLQLQMNTFSGNVSPTMPDPEAGILMHNGQSGEHYWAMYMASVKDQALTNPQNSLRTDIGLALNTQNLSGTKSFSPKFTVRANGDVIVGDTLANTIAKFEVNGQMAMRSGASNGYMVLSDADGLMTWTNPNTINLSEFNDNITSGLDIEQVLINGSNANGQGVENLGNTIIGEATGLGALHVKSTTLASSGSEDVIFNVRSKPDGGTHDNLFQITQKNDGTASSTYAQLRLGDEFTNTGTPDDIILSANGTSFLNGGDLIVDSNTLFVNASTNRVGIGTLSPIGNLTVKAQNRVITIGDSGRTNWASIKATNTAGTGAAYLEIDTYGTQYMQSGTLAYYHKPLHGGIGLYDVTGATEDVRISATTDSWFNGGSVAIGKTSPSSLLDIEDGNLTLSNTGAFANSSILIYSDDGLGTSFTQIEDFSYAQLNIEKTAATGVSFISMSPISGDGLGDVVVRAFRGSSTATDYRFDLHYDGAASVNHRFAQNQTTYINNISNNDLSLNVGGGNVGVGLTNPLERFVVSGGNMQLRGNTYTNFTDFWSGSGGDNSAFFTPYGFLGSSGAFAVSLYSNGYRNDTAGFTYIGTNGNTSTASGIDLMPTGDIYFRNGTASGTNLPIRMTIKNGGNTGIGTSNPSELLHVNGYARFGNRVAIGNATTSAADLYIYSTSNTNIRLADGSTYTDIYHNDGSGTSVTLIDIDPTGTSSGTNELRIDIDNTRELTLTPTGMGLNGITAPSATLDVNGDVEIATVNTDNTTDDVLVHSSDGTVSKRTLTSIGDEIDLNLGDDNLTLTGFRTVNLSNNNLQFQMNGTGVGHGGFWTFDASANSLNIFSRDNGAGGHYGFFSMSNPSTGFDLFERFNFFGGDGTSNYNIRIFDQTSTTGAKEVRIYNGALRLYDSGSASDIYLNPDGNSYIINKLGIGTSSPAEELEVEGGFEIGRDATSRVHMGFGDQINTYPSITNVGTADFFMGGAVSNDFIIGARGNSAGEGLKIGSFNGSSFTTQMIVETISGNVGVGLTNPATAVEIYKDTPTLRISSSNRIDAAGNDEVLGAIDFEGYDASNISIGAKILARQSYSNWSTGTTHLAPTDLHFFVQDASSTDMTDHTTQTPALTIEGNNQFVGIGLTNPSQKLEVAGNIFTTNDGTTRRIRAYNIAGNYSELNGYGVFTGAAMSLYSSNGVNPIYIGLPANQWTNVITYMTGDATWNRNGTNVMRLNDDLTIYDSAGNSDIYLNPNGDSYIMNNLGIGTDLPQEELHVAGDFLVEDMDNKHLFNSFNYTNTWDDGVGTPVNMEQAVNEFGFYIKTTTNHPMFLRTNNTNAIKLEEDQDTRLYGTLGIGNSPFANYLITAFQTGTSSNAQAILQTGGENYGAYWDYKNTRVSGTPYTWRAGMDSDSTFMIRDQRYGKDAISIAPSSNLITFNQAYTFPNTDGTSGQVLTTNGSGVVSWQSPTGDGDGIYDGSGTVPSSTAVTITNNINWGSNLMYMDYTNTEIGINTNSPTHELDVNGDVLIRDYMRIGGTGTDNDILMGVVGSTNLLMVNYYPFKIDLTTASEDFIIETGGGANIEALRIDGATGYIGIHENTPSAELDVVGRVVINDTDNTFINGGNDTHSGASYNVGIGSGSNALSSLTNGDNNISVGYQSGNSITEGFHNISIGSQAGSALTTEDRNTLIGGRSGKDITGHDNVFVGFDTGVNATTAEDNVFIGTNAGSKNTTGDRNIYIGYDVGTNASHPDAESDMLRIDNSNTLTPLIEGDFSTDELTINGDLSVTEHVYASFFNSITTTLVNGDTITIKMDSTKKTKGALAPTLTTSGDIGKITINKTSTYKIDIQVTTDNISGGARTESSVELYVNDVLESGTFFGMYNRIANRGLSTGATSTILDLNDGDELRIRGFQTGGDTIITVADGTRVTIVEMF